MKRIIGAVIFCAVTAISGAIASAQVGDVAGQIYSTDILAYINGYKTNAYNIGGKTAVVIEDLGMYGMDYDFHEDTRELYAYILLNTDKEFWFKNQQYDAPYPSISVERGQVGEILGNIYETDIKVIFAGHEIQGYNIGGKTAVCIEDLGTPDGTSPNEQYGYTKYMCNFEWNEKDREVKLNGLKGHSYFANMLAVNYNQIDNNVTASYNEKHDYWHGISANITDGAKEEPYTIKTLYLTVGDETNAVGYSFITQKVNTWNEVYYGIKNAITDLDKSKEMIKKLRPEPIPLNDIIAKFDDGVNYKTLNTLETEDYIVIEAHNLTTDDEYNNIDIISASKIGGYYYWFSGGRTSQTITLEKTGKNMIEISWYPDGRGGVTTQYNLEDYSPDKL